MLRYNIPLFVQVSSILATVFCPWTLTHKTSVTEPRLAVTDVSDGFYCCRVRIVLLLWDGPGRGDRGQRGSWDIVVHLKMEDLRSWLSHTIDCESWMTFTFKSMLRMVRTAHKHTRILRLQPCFQGNNLNIPNEFTADLALRKNQSVLGSLVCL